MIKTIFRVGIFVAGCVLVTSSVYADQIRYMDSSGTLHFVDSMAQVPRQYREQIYPATPTPVLDKRALADLKRRDKEEANRKLREQHEKKREAQRRQKEYELERRKEEKELQRREESSSLNR